MQGREGSYGRPGNQKTMQMLFLKIKKILRAEQDKTIYLSYK